MGKDSSASEEGGRICRDYEFRVDTIRNNQVDQEGVVKTEQFYLLDDLDLAHQPYRIYDAKMGSHL